MRRPFDPEAPWTVRAGAVCLACVNVFDFVLSLRSAWFDQGVPPEAWSGFLRPVIGLAAGMIWAWGIGQMLGLFYWTWVSIMSLLAGAGLVGFGLSLMGYQASLVTHELDVASSAGLGMVLIAYVLLVSKPSLQAYRRFGRLVPRKATESPDDRMNPSVGDGAARSRPRPMRTG